MRTRVRFITSSLPNPLTDLLGELADLLRSDLIRVTDKLRLKNRSESGHVHGLGHL